MVTSAVRCRPVSLGRVAVAGLILASVVVVWCAACRAASGSDKISDERVVSLQSVAPVAPSNRSEASDAAAPASHQVPLPDLGVAFIQRRPLYEKYQLQYRSHDRTGYLSGYSEICGPGCVNPRLVPGTEDDQRWPDPGEPVTLTAHVRNYGLGASPPFSYTWRLDGVLLEQGTLSALAAGDLVTTSVVIPWPHGVSTDRQRVLGEHTIAFAADALDVIPESTELNNLRQDRTDGLGMAIWVSQAVYDQISAFLNPDGATYSFDDWVQWHVDQFNRLFEEARFPVTPDGVSQRIRLDQIRICPTDVDCYTEAERRQADGNWGFPYLEDWYIDEILAPGLPDWALLHEWGHQLGLIDLYWVGTVPYFNHVLDHTGVPWLIGAQTRHWDSLMSTVTPVLDEHTAAALERNLGRRRGYYGEYLSDLPGDTRLLVLDAAGQPVSGAEVHVYQVTYDYQWMDHDLRFHGQTDPTGEFSLGAHPYGPLSVIGNNAVLFITVYARDQEDHFWLDAPDLNLLYWKGQTTVALVPLQSHIPPAGVPLPDAPVVRTKVVGDQVWLDWPAESGLTYDVYRASTPNAYYQRIVTATTVASFSESFVPYLTGTETARYAVRAVNQDGHPGRLGTAGASELVRPEGIAIQQDGQRLVLDHHHTEALLQRPDGAFVGQVTSTEDGLGERHDQVLDPQGYLYLQGADTGRIHVFDPAHHLLGVLAENLYGSWGVAYQGEGYGAAHALTVRPAPDGMTLLLTYLDDNLNGEDGEEGFGQEISFAPGQHGMGALLTGTATLTFTAAGNIQAERGAVEMWVQPLWDGDDGGNHTFFRWGGGGHQLHLRKDGISNLVFDYFSDQGGCGAPINVANWRAGEWRHLAFTWDTRGNTVIRLYVDGVQVAQTLCSGVAQPSDPGFWVGSDPFGPFLVVDAVVDDLRVSAVPRILQSASSYLFVSGGSRVNALDGAGRWVAELSLPEFVDLRGLAATGDGRLIVADAGAGQLHWLAFEGLAESLAYLGSLGGGVLSGPSDVILLGNDHLLVADTDNGRLALVDGDGELVASYTQPLPPYDDLALVSPRSVARDPLSGRLVVSDRDPARVVELAPVRPYRTLAPLVRR